MDEMLENHAVLSHENAGILIVIQDAQPMLL
jgi:hypothetical protein